MCSRLTAPSSARCVSRFCSSKFMSRSLILFLLFTFLLASCATPTPAVTPQAVTVYATSAVYPRLNDLYNCASSSVVIELADAQSADINLRLGEPADMSAPAYQIDSERSEEHTSELQSPTNLVCRLLL